MFSLVFLRSSVLLAVALGGLSPAPETHPFDLTRDQHQSFTFAVDGPGRIVARVTWQGAPLAVRLIGPGGTVAQKSARGSVELAYVVTSVDVSKGSAWRVALQSTERNGSLIAIVAKGTVTIEHPAGNIEKLKAQALAQRNQQMSSFRSRSIQLQQQAMAAQRAKLAQLQQAQQQAQQREQAALRQQVVALRTRATARPVRAGTPVNRSTIEPTSAASSGSGSSASEPLSVTSLSSSEGRPGDAILISGSGFGQSASVAGTTVHIIVAPGKDIQFGAPDYQSDTQIQTSIPSNISGVTDNAHAAIYVTTVSGTSALIPFHFKPAMATVTISVPTSSAEVDDATCDAFDQHLDQQGGTPYINSPSGSVEHLGGTLCGGSGNDVWNRGLLLKNGWTVVSIDPGKIVYPDADAYVSQSHAGTPDASFSVHWWTTGGFTGGGVFYAPVMYIHGPAGIPWN